MDAFPDPVPGTAVTREWDSLVPALMKLIVYWGGQVASYPRMSIIWTMAGSAEHSGMSWAAPMSQT